MNLPSAAFNPQRLNVGKNSCWSGHLPFARDLMAALRPSTFVELGTWLGDSYFGFCQAIAENAVDCQAYAVGSCQETDQSYSCDQSAFESLRHYNDTHYFAFSYLLDLPSDEALSQFEEESIGILHLNAPRTFDTAMRTFNAWLPKVSPGGVILLPGIMIRNGDNGVWKFWNTLVNRGASFEFRHDTGLGVFEKPSAQTARCEFLNTLFSGNSVLEAHLRRYYALCAMELTCKHHLERCTDRRIAGEYSSQNDCNSQINIDLSSLDPSELASPTAPDFSQQLELLTRERDSLIEQCNTQQTRIYLLSDSHTGLKETQEHLMRLEKTHDALKDDYQNLEQAYQRLVNQYQGLERTFNGIISSHSWRITSPLRSLFRMLSRG